MKTLSLLLGFSLLAGSAVAADDAAKAALKPLKVIQTEELQFPLTLKAHGVRTGLVRVVFYVDADGRLLDYLITGYTQEAFASEVNRVAPKWKFEPEIRNGVAVPTIVQMNFEFRNDGLMLVNYSNLEYSHMPADESKFIYEAKSLKALDQIPTPVNVVNPAYSKDLADKGLVGSVVVDFYIDETGKVRMPAALPGANPILAGLAAEAVEQWKFTPPTCKGRPVLVHAQQSFSFK